MTRNWSFRRRRQVRRRPRRSHIDKILNRRHVGEFEVGGEPIAEPSASRRSAFTVATVPSRVFCYIGRTSAAGALMSTVK